MARTSSFYTQSAGASQGQMSPITRDICPERAPMAGAPLAPARPGRLADRLHAAERIGAWLCDDRGSGCQGMVGGALLAGQAGEFSLSIIDLRSAGKICVHYPDLLFIVAVIR